nr:MAG TPA: nucelotide kinase [Caudoviricetes sp.]
MTIEEKADRIEAYCTSRYNCQKCPLHNNDESTCYESWEEYPEAIARNYATLFGDEQHDNVNHPAHYQGKNECIDVMLAMFGVEAVKHFCMCNAYKYRFRAGMKNGAEDIEKAEWYESKLIELGGVDECIKD